MDSRVANDATGVFTNQVTYMLVQDAIVLISLLNGQFKKEMCFFLLVTPPGMGYMINWWNEEEATHTFHIVNRTGKVKYEQP